MIYSGEFNEWLYDILMQVGYNADNVDYILTWALFYCCHRFPAAVSGYQRWTPLVYERRWGRRHYTRLPAWGYNVRADWGINDDSKEKLPRLRILNLKFILENQPKTLAMWSSLLQIWFVPCYFSYFSYLTRDW